MLLSNSARDMQQVLLAGGPYPADGLVSSLEMCARRGGSILPAVGQLTMDHLAPLQTFVRENTSVAKVCLPFLIQLAFFIYYHSPLPARMIHGFTML